MKEEKMIPVCPQCGGIGVPTDDITKFKSNGEFLEVYRCSDYGCFIELRSPVISIPLFFPTFFAECDGETVLIIPEILNLLRDSPPVGYLAPHNNPDLS